MRTKSAAQKQFTGRVSSKLPAFRRTTRVTPLQDAAVLSQWEEILLPSYEGASKLFESLTVAVNRDGLRKTERQSKFRAEMNVFLSGEESDSSSRPSAKRSPNEGALTATSNRADKRTSTRAAHDPGPIALLVVVALALRACSGDLISLPVEFDGLESELEASPAAELPEGRASTTAPST